MQGWKEKLLSQAGKEVMIKAVIQSIPTYSMSVFKLPISLCKDIEAMIRKFWWGQGDSKKIHWVKWSSLCSSKSIGGMDFRDIQKFNNALLVKQVWRLIHQKDTLLYKVFSAKYFPHGSIMDASVPQKCSYAWRSILQAREVIEKCAIWRVGSGHGIDVWKHRWLPNPTYNKIVSPRRESSVSRVSELFYPNTRIWDPGKLEENFYPWEAEMKRYRSFRDLLEAVMLKSSQFRVALFCTTAWSLWQRRNRLREKQPSWNLHELGSQAKAYVVDFLNANYQPSQVSSWRAQVSWSPPTESVYKGNFDAAFFDTSGCTGVGVVFHDFQGQVITALSQKIPLVQSVELVEAMAARRALLFAKELSLFDVEIEGDCSRVLAALNMARSCSTLFGYVIDECKSLGALLCSCKFSHVRREGNRLAHALARRAVISADMDVWVESLPSDLDSVF
ncbi:uncharacterized protein LOC115954851 [Quercus lobata]|uniref:uncharacterized protein LOC115954851 n=1 Tax=Quercus lobata TaxID=97700 RepID=UPI001243F07E|nr:uncharacterized protein LOC115954851 [Quercus lobata]